MLRQFLDLGGCSAQLNYKIWQGVAIKRRRYYNFELFSSSPCSLRSFFHKSKTSIYQNLVASCLVLYYFLRCWVFCTRNKHDSYLLVYPRPSEGDTQATLRALVLFLHLRRGMQQLLHRRGNRANSQDNNAPGGATEERRDNAEPPLPAGEGSSFIQQTSAVLLKNMVRSLRALLTVHVCTAHPKH